MVQGRRAKKNLHLSAFAAPRMEEPRRRCGVFLFRRWSMWFEVGRLVRWADDGMVWEGKLLAGGLCGEAWPIKRGEVAFVCVEIVRCWGWRRFDEGFSMVVGLRKGKFSV